MVKEEGLPASEELELWEEPLITGGVFPSTLTSLENMSTPFARRGPWLPFELCILIVYAGQGGGGICSL